MTRSSLAMTFCPDGEASVPGTDSFLLTYFL
jgi:hypothetical protein